MIYKNIPVGNDIENAVNVIIEIPTNSAPVKYEVDKESGALCVDRFLNTAMYYPCNYGYVPNTLSEDGDPVDVLVITPAKLISGALIAVRPIGILKMVDEKGNDAKILSVPARKLTSLYDDVNEPKDLPQQLLDTISHFFQHYKDLEPNKWVKVEGWDGPEAALEELNSSIERFQSE